MHRIKLIKQIEADVKRIEARKRELLKSFKYVVYTQQKIYYLEINEGTCDVGEFTHTDDVAVCNSSGDFSYTHLHSDSLISAILHCTLNWCEIYAVNRVHTNHWQKVASFVRKNAEALRAHPELEKLESMLATGSLDNLLLVMQLLKHT